VQSNIMGFGPDIEGSCVVKPLDHSKLRGI